MLNEKQFFKMKKLAQGWVNYLKSTDIPQERLDDVRTCPNRVKASIFELRLKDKYQETDGFICSECFCPLPTKLRAEKCKCDGFR